MSSLIKLLVCFTVLFCACSGIKDSPKYQLSDGKYGFRQTQSKYKNAYVYVQDDSIQIYLMDDLSKPFVPQSLQSQYFLKRSFDIDVITVPFKFRPAITGLPRQLNTDFNGQVFIGYRLDRFGLDFKKTPVGLKKFYHHRAISIGGFGGLGSAAITSSTTNNKTTDEYNGFVLSRGLALMIGINHLTVGIGVGWDYLTDRDKKIWIYQNQAWYGLTLGLNLN